MAGQGHQGVVSAQRFDRILGDWVEQQCVQLSAQGEASRAELLQTRRDHFDQLIKEGQFFVNSLHPSGQVFECLEDVKRADARQHSGAPSFFELPQDSQRLHALKVYTKNSQLPLIDAKTWSWLLCGLYKELKKQYRQTLRDAGGGNDEGIGASEVASDYAGDDNNSAPKIASQMGGAQSSASRSNLPPSQYDRGSAKAHLTAWHQFFEHYQSIRRERHTWKARALSFVYASIQGMISGLAILFCVMPIFPFLATAPMWAQYTIPLSIALLAYWTNYRMAVPFMKDALAQVGSAWYAVRYLFRHKYSVVRLQWPHVVGGGFLCICGAAVMAALSYGGVTRELPKLFQQIGVGGLANVTMGVGIACIAVVGVFEIILFFKSCVSIVRQGGFRRVIEDALDVMMRGGNDENASPSSRRTVKALTIALLALMLIANISGLTFMVLGSVSDMRGMFGFSNLAANAAYYATAICAAAGMGFFFFRSALGWSYDMGKCYEQRKAIWDHFKQHKGKLLLRNAVRLVGLAVCIGVGIAGLMGVPGLGFGVGLAVLLASMVVNIVVAKWLEDGGMKIPDTQNMPNAPVDPTVMSNGLGNAAITGVGLEKMQGMGVAVAPAVGSLTLSSVSNVHTSSIPSAVISDQLVDETVKTWSAIQPKDANKQGEGRPDSGLEEDGDVLDGQVAVASGLIRPRSWWDSVTAWFGAGTVGSQRRGASKQRTTDKRYPDEDFGGTFH